MKDTQHTPGPWKTGGCGEDGWRMILGPKTRFYHAFGESHTTSIADVSISDCESEDLANARLIAAAPDMLSALRDAIKWAESAPSPYREWPFIVSARAAIARATGNQ